jgi:hypothetical protein
VETAYVQLLRFWTTAITFYNRHQWQMAAWDTFSYNLAAL